MNLNDTETHYIYEECSVKELSDKQVIEAVKLVLYNNDEYKFYKEFRVAQIGEKKIVTSTGGLRVERNTEDEIADFLDKP